MKDVKLNVSITIPGRVLLSEDEAECMSGSGGYELTRITVEDKKGKKDILNVRSRACRHATRSINMSREAYNYMQSEEAPVNGIKMFVWKKMKPEKRLIAHLQELCKAFDGISFTYKVFED